MVSYFYEKSKFYYEMHLKNQPVQKVCAIIKHNNKFLALVKNNSISSFPGGSVDANENVEDALTREVLEEANAIVESFEFVTENHYSVPWEFEKIKFENKRVEYYFLCTIKNENLKAIGLSGEFDKNTTIQWCTISELEKLNHSPFELDLIKKL